MRLVVVIISLLAVFAVPVYGQPLPPANAQLTTTVSWDLLPGTIYEVSVDGKIIAPALTTNTITFPKPGPGLHIAEIVAIDDQKRRSAVSSKSWIETAGAVPPTFGPCTYVAPGSMVPEQRPIGQEMQGFNPIGPSGVVNNQADRIRILKTWGWEVDLAQFVEGNLRADKIDRLFLIVRCRGL